MVLDGLGKARLVILRQRNSGEWMEMESLVQCWTASGDLDGTTQSRRFDYLVGLGMRGSELLPAGLSSVPSLMHCHS